MNAEERFLCRMPRLSYPVHPPANPETWEDWLTGCELRGESPIVMFYGETNCNYLVTRGRVIRNYGYHGRYLFETLSNPVERREFFESAIKNIEETESILGRCRIGRSFSD